MITCAGKDEVVVGDFANILFTEVALALLSGISETTGGFRTPAAGDCSRHWD